MAVFPGPLQELAPAKVNLALHVTGRRPDGYHLLDSLVVFARVGDMLEAEPAAGVSLTLGGKFGGSLGVDGDNSVLRAAALLRPQGQGAALRLTKVLPVAAGLGGGSADAAAALRLLARLWGLPLPRAEETLALGADVPVCLAGRAARMRGIGERLDPVDLPPFWLVLANPGVPVSTPAVFAALAARENPGLPPIPALGDAAELCAWLGKTRNDLETPARAIAPEVAATLEALAAQPGCGLARMSGSGATCVGIFAKEAAALDAMAALRAAHPRWWAMAAPALTERGAA